MFPTIRSFAPARALALRIATPPALKLVQTAFKSDIAAKSIRQETMPATDKFDTLIREAEKSFDQQDFTKAKELALDALSVYCDLTTPVDPFVAKTIEHLKLCDLGSAGQFSGF